jgi:hypothetical protein
VKKFNKGTCRPHPEAEDGIVPSSIYDQMVEHMPIPSVEAIVVLNNSLLF